MASSLVPEADAPPPPPRLAGPCQDVSAVAATPASPPPTVLVEPTFKWPAGKTLDRSGDIHAVSAKHLQASPTPPTEWQCSLWSSGKYLAGKGSPSITPLHTPRRDCSVDAPELGFSRVKTQLLLPSPASRQNLSSRLDVLEAQHPPTPTPMRVPAVQNFASPRLVSPQPTFGVTGTTSTTSSASPLPSSVPSVPQLAASPAPSRVQETPITQTFSVLAESDRPVAQTPPPSAGQLLGLRRELQHSRALLSMHEEELHAVNRDLETTSQSGLSYARGDTLSQAISRSPPRWQSEGTSFLNVEDAVGTRTADSRDCTAALELEISRLWAELLPGTNRHLEYEVVDTALRDRWLAELRRNGCLLRTAPLAFQNDWELVLGAVSTDGVALRFASEELQGDKAVVLAAVAQDGAAVRFATPELQADRQVVVTAVTRNGEALGFASDELRADREVVLLAVSQNVQALRFASSTLRRDPDVERAVEISERKRWLHEVRAYGPNLQRAPAAIRGNREVVLAAVSQNGCALQFASVALRADREIVLRAVSKSGERARRFALASLQEEPRIIEAAAQAGVTQLWLNQSSSNDADPAVWADSVGRRNTSPGRVLIVSQSQPPVCDSDVAVASTQPKDEDLCSNLPPVDCVEYDDGGGSPRRITDIKLRNHWLQQVSADGASLQGAPPQMQDDRAVVLAAVSGDGLALAYASASLRADRDVVLASITQNSRALHFASEAMLGDEVVAEVMRRAERDHWLRQVGLDGFNLHGVPAPLNGDREVVLAAVSQNGLALAAALAPLRDDREVVLAAVSQNGLALDSASEALQADKLVALAAVSQQGAALLLVCREFRADKEVILAASAADPRALQHVDARGRDGVLAAVAVSGRTLRYAPDVFRGDREIVLAAVAENGRALRYAAEELRDDKEVVLTAVAENRKALQYASDTLRGDKDVAVAGL